MVGGTPRFVRLDEDWAAAPPRWRLDLEKLFAACDARTKAIFIASPGNPTGWVMSRDEQLAVLDFARDRGIAIISDEVYGTPGVRCAPACALVPRTDHGRRRRLHRGRFLESLGYDRLAHRLAGASARARRADGT